MAKRIPKQQAAATEADDPSEARAAKELGARLKTAIEAAGGYEAAAEVLDVHPNTLRRMTSGENDPKFSVVAALARLSGYRVDWLAYNELPEKRVDADSPPPAAGLRERFYWVPELDARAAAGHGAMNHELEVKAVFPVPLSMIEGMGVMAERLRMTEATGDSMLPDIRHGDRLLFVIGEDSLRDGAIYVLNFGDDTLVKQIQIEPDGGVTLLSKNPAFAPRKISPDDRQSMSIVGRVVGAIKRFT